MKKGSYLVTFGVLALVLVSVYGGYLYVKKGAMLDKLEASAIELLEAEDALVQYEDDNIFDAINAKRAYSDLSESIVNWSDVIAQVNKMIPDDTIEILSYSFSGSDSVSISVRTKPTNKDAYVSVANLIKVIDESKYFSGIFVPSVSAGVDAEGHESMSFAFSLKYLKDGSGGVGAVSDKVWDSTDIGEFDDFDDAAAVDKREIPVEEPTTRGRSNSEERAVSRS